MNTIEDNFKFRSKKMIFFFIRIQQLILKEISYRPNKIKHRKVKIDSLIQNVFSRFLIKLKKSYLIPENESLANFQLENSTLSCYIKIKPDVIKGKGVGSIIFHDAINIYNRININKIKGQWFKNFDLGDNHKTFMLYFEQSNNLEYAAFSTFTGKMAKKYGFNFVTNISQINDVPFLVEVYFFKSKNDYDLFMENQTTLNKK